MGVLREGRESLMPALPNFSDRSRIVFERFDQHVRDAVLPLITKKIIAEHKRAPLGDHSDPLARVLNYLRRSPSTTPFVIVCTKPFREWRIAKLSSERGKAPTLVDDQTYTSEAKAMHALFPRRIEILSPH
jgi:branched-chain amino acid transport system permease protein